jgi:hypothetical protein
MRRLLFAVVLACAWSLVAAQIALGASIHRVSRGDPFAGCALGAPDPAVYGPDYHPILYPGAEVEPWLATDPRDGSRLVGAWQQDRWQDGGARGLVAGWSSDGGGTWHQVPLPFSLCAASYYGGNVSPYDRASDPWVSIGPDGRVYAVSLSFNENDFNNAIAAAVSTDGGRTWHHQQNIITDLDSDPTQFGDDKESVTADPTRPGWAYVVWDRFETVPCGPRIASSRVSALHDRTSARRAPSLRAAAACITLTGPTWFSRTKNGGITWDAPKRIVLTPPDEQTIGNQIVVDRQTGALYDFYNYIDAAGQFHVKFSKSTDHGTTWGPPQLVGELNSLAETRPAGVVDPRDATRQIRTGDIIPEPAIDPHTGRLYVVWQDRRFNGAANDMLVIATSPRGGASWSAATPVNPQSSKSAFTAAIAVDDEGRVGVTYYDFRSLGTQTPSSVLPTDYWFARTSGPGVAFTSEQHLDGPFNMLAAPNARGYFTGDYEGLATSGDTFYPFYVKTNCRGDCRDDGDDGGATDVFSTAIGGDNRDGGD